MNQNHALKVLLVDQICYEQPEMYRAKIPGYSTHKNHIINNTNKTRKILRKEESNLNVLP